MTIIGHNTLTDLGQGNTKTFTVAPGNSVTLSTNVTDGHNKYAVAIMDLEKGGIENNGNKLAFTPDSGWSNQSGMNPPYYVSSSSRHEWSGSATQRNFQLFVDESTPPDFYALRFEVAGKNGGRWSQIETFYLHVQSASPVPGDGDIDDSGSVDTVDFALLAEEWLSPGCTPDNDFCNGADINVDGDVNLADLMEIALRWLTRESLAVKVADGADDAEESLDSGAVSLTSSDLELIQDASAQLVGVRFRNIQVGPGTDIAAAFIQFTVDETSTGPCDLIIEGQASDNAPAFTTQPGDISARTATTAFAQWSPPDWNTVAQAGPDQQTPDLAEIIEEIVDTPGWQTGNSIVFIFTGTGKRTAEAFDGNSTTAPILHIQFQ
jgi:hypothetical protein